MLLVRPAAECTLIFDGHTHVRASRGHGAHPPGHVCDLPPGTVHIAVDMHDLPLGTPAFRTFFQKAGWPRPCLEPLRWCTYLDHLNSVIVQYSAPLRTVGECSRTTAVPPEMSARSAQTLSMLVKVVGRVSVLGRVPSDMRRAAQEEWHQDLHSPRGRRRRTWWCSELTFCFSKVPGSMICIAPASAAHSPHVRECARYLSHGHP